ncbi:MAG: hypothetical protein GY786_18815 [Proteobacteria bacterium]|nr:hypothetical protein [Pseudomonadota bacterium]
MSTDKRRRDLISTHWRDAITSRGPGGPMELGKYPGRPLYNLLMGSSDSIFIYI